MGAAAVVAQSVLARVEEAMSRLAPLRMVGMRVVARDVRDSVTGNVSRMLVPIPRMPPVPSGTFVRKEGKPC